MAQLALLSLAVECVAPPSAEEMTKNNKSSGGRQDDDGIGSSDDETVSSDTAKGPSSYDFRTERGKGGQAFPKFADKQNMKFG